MRGYKKHEKEGVGDWTGTNSSSHVSSLTAMLNVWMKFECFYRYKAVCASRYDLSGNTGESDVVHLADLTIVWIMLYAFLLVCIAVFVLELINAFCLKIMRYNFIE